jgi:hypothetical protein
MATQLRFARGRIRERCQCNWYLAIAMHALNAAAMARRSSGNAFTTDGPFVETKELLGG